MNTTTSVGLFQTFAADSTGTTNKTSVQILDQIESTMGVYLYPCLIEYSLISLTVFFIMWRNVGKIEKTIPVTFW